MRSDAESVEGQLGTRDGAQPDAVLQDVVVRAVLAAAAEGINLLDLRTGCYEYMNPAQVALTGFTLEEINQISAAEALERCHPDDRHISAEQQARIVAGESDLGVAEYRWRVKSGEYRWFRDSRRVLRDERGEAWALVGVSTDVTDAATLYEEVTQSRGALLAAIDSMLDPFVVLEAVRDEAGTIVDFVFSEANAAACDFNRLSHDELVGSRLLGLHPAAGVTALLEEYRGVVESGEPLVLDDWAYPQDLLDGEVRYYDVRAVKLGDGLSQTWRDVTGRHLTAVRIAGLNAMREATERIARVGSWRWDLDSGLVEWSPEMYLIHGVDPMTFDGDFRVVMESGVHPDDADRVRTAYQTHLAGGGPVDIEYRIVRGDGSACVVRSLGQPETREEADGRVLVGFTQDVTELRAAEDDVRRMNAELEDLVSARTAQLEEANRELEAFIYSAAHDLRAPLRAIDGYDQMVIEDAGSRLSEADVDHLERSRAAAQRMGLLIDRLLEISRLGKRDVAPEPVDFTALARDVCAEASEGRPDREVEVVIEPGMAAVADPTLLRVVVQNLVDNAFKFTAAHASARIEIGTADTGRERAFFVRDDGVGFDAAAAGQLFGAFQRFHAPSEYPGDGIGLATVRRLVALHGGRVWAESAVEAGTTFFFTLPAPAGG